MILSTDYFSLGFIFRNRSGVRYAPTQAMAHLRWHSSMHERGCVRDRSQPVMDGIRRLLGEMRVLHQQRRAFGPRPYGDWHSDSTRPAGATAQCRDGTWSWSEHPDAPGTC